MKYEDEVKGKGKQIKGAVKEELGKLTGNRDLENSGTADRVEGDVQEGFGKTKRKIGEAVEKVGKRIAS
jgi:uncharacterized protein YjbJ (UPF0337 family)